MLKIGLTYEKINNYDKALSYYEKTCADIIAFRDLDVHDLQLEEVTIKRENYKNDSKLQELETQCSSTALFEKLKQEIAHGKIVLFDENEITLKT